MSLISNPSAAADLVRGLYRGLLGREPDPSGLQHWQERLAGGADAAELVAALSGSDEYRALRAAAARKPALAAALVAAVSAEFGTRALTIVDIGAQELEDERHVYAPLTEHGLDYRIVGFEPQEDKIAASLARNPDSRVRLYPTFIGDGAAHTFHINNTDATSSLLPLNPQLNRELVYLSHLETVQREPVSTRRLDEVLDDGAPVDFLKLDIQGFELPVLQHAAAVLARTNVIHCEVSFAPIYDGQALFAEIELLLRAAGFEFIDFSAQCRYSYHTPSGSRAQDRLGWGDAVFFRAPELLATPHDLLAQCLAALLVYDKPTLAERLAQRYDAATGASLAALFALPSDQEAHA